MKCPHCNKEHSDDTKYCPNTGKKIELLACQNRECQDFGKKIRPADSKYCPSCGQRLDVSGAIVIIEPVYQKNGHNDENKYRWRDDDEEMEDDIEIDDEGDEDDFDYDDNNASPNLLGKRITIVSSNGGVLYTHDDILCDDDFIVSDNAVYICSKSGNSENINCTWLKIDKAGNRSTVNSDNLPIINDFYGNPEWYQSCKNKIFLQKHPEIYATEFLGRQDGVCYFAAYTEQQSDDNPNGAKVYDENFTVVYTITNGLRPVKVFSSGYYLVKDDNTERYGIIDMHQQVILPCLYEWEIEEVNEGIFRLCIAEVEIHDSENIYDAKNNKWYIDVKGNYVVKCIHGDSYQLINRMSGAVIAESDVYCFSDDSGYMDGFVTMWWNGDQFLCKDDRKFTLEFHEVIQEWGNSGLHVSEGRIITLLFDSNGDELLWRIRDYDGRIIKELDPSYRFRRGYKNGKALFIKDYSPRRKVGFVDMDGNVTILPTSIPKMEDDEFVEITDVDCEFVSESTILVTNDYYKYLIKVDGSIIINRESFISAMGYNVLLTNKYYGDDYKEAICDGAGDDLYVSNETSLKVKIIK